jgi:3-deoxy-D-manno-octulosonic acid kinase
VRVPAGFETEPAAGAWIAARPEARDFVAAAIRSAGSLYALARSAGGAEMRGRTAAVALGGPDGEWVVRHYARGGAIAPLLGDRYLRVGTPRPAREAAVSDRARALGVATPEVRAFAVYPSGLFYRAEIATARIADAADLAAVSLGPDAGDDARRTLAWRAAGLLLRRAFDAGLVHSDLNLRNVLIAWADGEAMAHLLDLDGGRVVKRISPRHVHAMLQRLHRSRLKLERQTGSQVGAAALAAFEEALGG